MNRNKTYFLAVLDHVVNGFLSGLSDRTHGNDHAVSIGRAVVVEKVIFAASDFGDFGHIVFNDFGNCLIVAVACLTMLEENVAVFSHTASHGSVGGEGAFAERCESLAVEQRLEILSVELLDLLNFV